MDTENYSALPPLDTSDDDDGPAAVGGLEPGAASIVDLLKADQASLAESKEVFIKIVGYDFSQLQVKYHMPENGKQLDDITRKVMREVRDTYSRNLLIAIDMMIFLCEGLYVQPPEVEEPVIFDPYETGTACRFDEKLAKSLGWDGVDRAREVVRRVFGNNDMAIISHGEKLNRWLANTKADLNLEFWQLGET